MDDNNNKGETRKREDDDQQSPGYGGSQKEKQNASKQGAGANQEIDPGEPRGRGPSGRGGTRQTYDRGGAGHGQTGGGPGNVGNRP